MNCIPINYAECIIEPFWDSGESYPEHQKFNRITNYKITCAPGSVCSVDTVWCGNRVVISKQTDDGYAISLERDCDLDVSGYDIFRICTAMSSKVQCRITCTIDNAEQTVMEFVGINKRYEYDGIIKGSRITHIKMEFKNLKNEPSSTTLYWLGIANSKKQAEFRSAPGGFDTNWDGCFSGECDFTPTIGLYCDEVALDDLRIRLSQYQFKEIMDGLRQKAQSLMDIVPEEYIGQYYMGGNVQVARCYEYGCIQLTHTMQDLAWVGIIDRNEDMLRLACRMALSVCCCHSWEDNFMCDFPGSTWSRRSFVISACCSACSLVLDFAGSMLTWHGRNIIYNALAMKGLPRLESDFHMVEYIRHCNQGVDFCAGRIAALIALCSKYPRYEKRLSEAEADLYEILDTYITSDGGVLEGASYWAYTLKGSIPSLLMLARRRGISLEEAVPDCIKRSEDYALACLTDSSDYEILPYNDAHYGVSYNLPVVMLFCRIGKSKVWQSMYLKLFNPQAILGMYSIDTALLMLPDIESDIQARIADFITVNDVGQTSVRFDDENLGRVHLHLLSGEAYFAHNHEDKGSFVLEVNGDTILIDRGTGEYASGLNLCEAQYHNLLCPINEDGIPYKQPAHPAGCGGRVLEARKSNGEFTYCTQLSDAWEEGVFKSNTRSVRMNCADTLCITDDAELCKSGRVMLLFNTHGHIRSVTDSEFVITKGDVEINISVNSSVGFKAVWGEYGVDDKLNAVNRLCLITDKAIRHHITTLIRLNKNS